MTASILDMAKELVIEAIKGNALSPDEARDLLENTHAALLRLHRVETGEPAASPEQAEAAESEPADWRKSIQKYTVTCLECGEIMKRLSAQHLTKHGLNPRSYRHKYGIPLSQALSAHEVTARRRELAQDIQPWRRAAEMRAAARQTGKKAG